MPQHVTEVISDIHQLYMKMAGWPQRWQ